MLNMAGGRTVDAAPLVSVIMPVYNPGQYLEDAIRSILEQTYRNLELVIIREFGSKDSLPSIVNELDDNRIVLLHNESRLGLAESLNFGIGKAHGELIARMDCDDVSMPARLEKQVKVMVERPTIGILGTHLSFVRGTPSTYDNTWFPPEPAAVRWRMHFHNALAHPTVMMRREIWEKLDGYSPEAEPCEDYDLWLRAMRMTDIANLPEPLVTYRILEESVSGARREEQRLKAQGMAMEAVRASIGEEVKRDVLLALVDPYRATDARFGVEASDLAYRLRFALVNRNNGDDAVIREEVNDRLSLILFRSIGLKPSFAPIIMWHAARFGAPVLFRLVLNVGRQGVRSFRWHLSKSGRS